MDLFRGDKTYIGVEVITVIILWVTVNALPLRFAPADAPRTVPCRSSNRSDGTDIVAAKVSKLEDQHAAHGATNNSSNLPNSETVEDKLEDTES